MKSPEISSTFLKKFLSWRALDGSNSHDKRLLARQQCKFRGGRQLDELRGTDMEDNECCEQKMLGVIFSQLILFNIYQRCQKFAKLNQIIPWNYNYVGVIYLPIYNNI